LSLEEWIQEILITASQLDLIMIQDTTTTEGTAITAVLTEILIHQENSTSRTHTNAVVAEAEASKSNLVSLQLETTKLPLKEISLNISPLSRNDLNLSLSQLKKPNGDGLTRVHSHNQHKLRWSKRLSK